MGSFALLVTVVLPRQGKQNFLEGINEVLQQQQQSQYLQVVT